MQSTSLKVLSRLAGALAVALACGSVLAEQVSRADLQVCTAAYFSLVDGVAEKPSPAVVGQARALVAKLETECPQCFVQRATCRAVAGDYNGAERELKSALELVKSAKLQGRNDAEIAGYSAGEYLGDIYYLADRHADAITTYRSVAVASNPVLIGVYRKIGRVQERVGDYAEAEKSWKEAIRLSQGQSRVSKGDPPQTCRLEEVMIYLDLVKMQIAGKQCTKASATLREAKLTNPVCSRWKVGDWREDVRCP